MSGYPERRTRLLTINGSGGTPIRDHTAELPAIIATSYLRTTTSLPPQSIPFSGPKWPGRIDRALERSSDSHRSSFHD